MRQPLPPWRLDARERHFTIASPVPGLDLFLRYLPPRKAATETRIALYVHGATFPSALSIAHRFDGVSWRDELAAAGFHVWGFDFLGFGDSGRYGEMAGPADAAPPLGRAELASRQIEAAVEFILARHNAPRLSLVAHSWGTIATGCFAARRPDLVERLAFFGPITWRAGQASSAQQPAWRLVSLGDQWTRFIADVPKGEPPVLSERHFAEWGELYLDSDRMSRERTPPSVKIPNGPSADIAAAWSGDLAYDPTQLRAPLAILRGEWDSLVTDADARWLLDHATSSPQRRDVKIPRATHLMHLEQGRHELHRATTSFLLGKE